MEVGSTVTWREGVVTMKSGRRIKTGERTVSGTIIEHSRHPRTGGETIKIAVTAVTDMTGAASDISGTEVWRKRAKVSKGRSWLKAMKDRARARRYRENMKSQPTPPRR